MMETAIKEFANIVKNAGWILEQNRAVKFLSHVLVIDDNPSQQFKNLIETSRVGKNYKIIFRTEDKLNIVTMTGDAKFVRGSNNQGGGFNYIDATATNKLREVKQDAKGTKVYVHDSVPLTGK